MLLKSLSLVGFKSFADRTRLEFEPGVTVVVGPNGSGKSNLLDAIAWAMGTQATSGLRTEKMGDVIFAGTATRPGLGRAEVNVTFDNADGFLPLELTEITMTRRLLRDGTSEYALNGTTCRLLDLQELLSDGGVGKHQHVLVGQGEIGEILTARSDEQRAVIEEAAGITKHRSRRDRSIRRLDATDVDVARLNDILVEQRRRLRPLKRQANAADQYDSVKAEARALRLWLCGTELTSIRERLVAAAQEEQALEDGLAKNQVSLSELVAALDDLHANAGETGQALSRDTAAAARLETVAERFHRITMVARERRSGLVSRLRGTTDRRHDLELEVADLQTGIATARDEAQVAVTFAERTGVTLQALEDEERSLAEQVQLPADGLVATLRGDLRALETASARDDREGDALRQRLSVVEGRLTEEDREIAALDAAVRSTDTEVGRLQERYTTAKAAREGDEETWKRAEAGLQERRFALVEAVAKAEAIETAIAGLGNLEARDAAAALDEVLGPVIAMLDVPDELVPAFVAALGPWSDALATPDEQALAHVVGTLKAGGLGGVTLVAGGLTEGEDTARLTRKVAAEWGIEALIDHAGPNANHPLAVDLLGDVVLVEGWSTGWRLLRRYPSLRAVTPEGDLIMASGMRLGQPDGLRPVSLDATRVAVESAERELARVESHHVTALRALRRTQDEERSALEALEELEAKLAGHTEALGLVTRARAESQGEHDRLARRFDSLAEADSARRERLTQLRSTLDDLEGEEAGRQKAWDALNRRREEVAGRRDEARRAREAAAADVAGKTERFRLLEGRLAAAHRELTGLGGESVDPKEITALASLEDRARTAHAVVRSHVEALRSRQRDLRKDAGEAGERLAEAQAGVEALRVTIEEAKDARSNLAIELAELRVRDESVAERVRRDADGTEEEALAAPRPELKEGVDPTERAATLEAQLRRMGPINPLAAAEYQELSDHVVLLEGQLADLDQSRQELHKVISALDDEMATMFMEAFEEISRLYEENFTLVFPGGKGRLRLTDPDRPLETGVELEAQPHGKKIGRLSLLSGGERSLAALAFLFAVFRARPSPFYVLDEVEAALDDANLRRFLRLVDTLRETAQLVIITHQQQTMEAADILYGVTMEPGGSSKVVAKRLTPVRA